jgi:hypothetical protein
LGLTNAYITMLCILPQDVHKDEVVQRLQDAVEQYHPDTEQVGVKMDPSPIRWRGCGWSRHDGMSLPIGQAVGLEPHRTLLKSAGAYKSLADADASCSHAKTAALEYEERLVRVPVA